MMEDLLSYLSVFLIAAPFALMVWLGMIMMFGLEASEKTIGRAVMVTFAASLVAALVLVGDLIWLQKLGVTIDLGNWVSIPVAHYHFAFTLQLDVLSITFVLLSLLLCGVIARFAIQYLHREPGFRRFFFLYAMFTVGMTVTSLAGSIESLFAGWELVGLSSAFLVAFFDRRVMPAVNGFRIWSVYRIADAALLLAAIMLHHMSGEGLFASICGSQPWPTGTSAITGWEAFAVGLLILFAAMGKSALVPFSGWLPRAMEGPTPSSAVYYGALSVHLGAFLLLRMEPLLDQSVLLRILIVVVGIATAVVAVVAGSVQPDIKATLSFASLVQVGIIVAEIGLGLRVIALIHIVGHALLRTLQFLRAPTLLHDYHLLENAIGGHLPRHPHSWLDWFGRSSRLALYRFGLERGRLDIWLDTFIVAPFVRLFQFLNRIEIRTTDAINGTTPSNANAEQSIERAL